MVVMRRKSRSLVARALALVAFASVAFASRAHAGAFQATDSNFESAVMNSGKNVFVKYLAPWYAIEATT